MRELESLCHQWIQLTEDEYGLIEEREDILHTGYSYDGIYGVDMIKFHVDDHECLQELAKNKYGSFGGNVSIRAAPGRPIIIIGQDESIYNQYAFGQKQWVGPAGERAFLPKTDGAGWMVSGMQCVSLDSAWSLPNHSWMPLTLREWVKSISTRKPQWM